MTAQILFSCALVGSWLYLHGQTRLMGPIKLLLYAVIFAGLFFVWSPDNATRLAHVLGIGRGADLIYYTWIILSLAFFINIHLKLRQNLTLVTQLARQIAIVEAERKLQATLPTAPASPASPPDAA